MVRELEAVLSAHAAWPAKQQRYRDAARARLPSGDVSGSSVGYLGTPNSDTAGAHRAPPDEMLAWLEGLNLEGKMLGQVSGVSCVCCFLRVWNR